MKISLIKEYTSGIKPVIVSRFKVLTINIENIAIIINFRVGANFSSILFFIPKRINIMTEQRIIVIIPEPTEI